MSGKNNPFTRLIFFVLAIYGGVSLVIGLKQVTAAIERPTSEISAVFSFALIAVVALIVLAIKD